jgi:geranylgeranyl reductase family protein
MILEYDVIIVGAGPAGSTVARSCAKQGLKTLLVEKDRFPRYKPCAGCLSPRVLGVLDFDITDVIESIVSRVKFTYQLKDPFSIISPNPIAYLVMRDSFDQFLCRKAQEWGADLYEGKVAGFQQDAEGVDVSIEGGKSPRCQYLVGADGARSIVARSLQEGMRKKTGIALQGERWWTSGIRKGRSSVHLDLGVVPNGYGWIVPKGNLISIGIGVILPSRGVKLKSRFERFIGTVDYIKGIEMEKTSFYPLPTFTGEEQLFSQGRVLLVGDAANLMDPLTGEGIYYAVRSARVAAETIIKANEGGREGINGYRKALKSTLLEDLTAALRLSKAIHRFPRLAYRVLKSNKTLGFIYLQILAGNADYRAFSRGMLDGIRMRLGEGRKPSLNSPGSSGEKRPHPRVPVRGAQ